MKHKRILALILSVFLIVTLFAGCAAGSAPAGGAVGGADYEVKEDGLSGSVDATGSVTPQNQKLIRTLYLHAETEDMDDLLAKVDERIAELGGYVEAREIYHGSAYSSSRYRSASLTIRIPAESLDAFVSHVGQVSNITSNRETTEDVTLTYVATESRLTALKAEETRLLELLSKAESLNDLLQIESRLTEVRTELEQVTSLLRVYDNLVNYGTIHLELEEVVEYTQPEPENIWDRIGTGFMKSLRGLWTLIVELFIFLIVSLPYLVLVGGIVTVVILLRRRSKKKKEQEINDAK